MIKVCKIYIKNNIYLKKAYHDAYKLMGNRNFEKVINKDNVWNSNCNLIDASDVTSTKEYIQVNISFKNL